VPGPGGGGRGGLRSQISRQAARNTRKRRKTGGFTHVLAYKSPKTPFFAPMYLTRYTHKTFFDKYVNFQNHYLSRFVVIPVQSFGSHIRPQPHGLGLTPNTDISICLGLLNWGPSENMACHMLGPRFHTMPVHLSPQSSLILSSQFSLPLKLLLIFL
jgi:hypothetical protein